MCHCIFVVVLCGSCWLVWEFGPTNQTSVLDNRTKKNILTKNLCVELNQRSDIISLWKCIPVRPLPVPVTSAGALLLSSRRPQWIPTYRSNTSGGSRRKLCLLRYYRFFHRTKSLLFYKVSCHLLAPSSSPVCGKKRFFPQHGKVFSVGENVPVAPPGSNGFHPEAEELAATFHCRKSS